MVSPSPSLASSQTDDLLHAFSEDIVAVRAPTAPESEIIIEVEGLGRGLKLAVDASPGCGGIAWPAGEVLSRYLSYRHSQDPDCLRNKRILELGSGTGLVGLVAALLENSADVVITDQDQLLELMQQNVDLNFPPLPDEAGRNIKVAELDWGKEIPSTLDAASDVILAADCVYFEPAFPLLVDTLCRLAPVGEPREILFCWKKRRKADKRFFQMLHKHFMSTAVDDDRPGQQEIYERDGVKLMRLVRKK